MPEGIQEIQAAEFPQQVLAGGPAIVDWYSTDCPPCEALAAKFEPLARLYGERVRFIKVFRQENRALAESLGIKGSPTVQFYLDGQEAAPRLTGGIRRAELLGGLDSLLPPEAAAPLRARAAGVRLRSHWDLVVLGGGPSGLTAAIYAAQAKLKVVVVDLALPGGRVKTTHSVSNYPGFADPLSGALLGHAMHQQAQAHGVQFRAAVDVGDLDLAGRTLSVDGVETLRGRHLILATGASPRLLGVPGEAEGAGNGISYCATCDAKYYQGKEVVVIGGGNAAVEEGLFIAKFSSRLTLLHRGGAFSANPMAVERLKAAPGVEFRLGARPLGFSRSGDGGLLVRVEEVASGAHSTLRTDGVFIFIGMRPNTQGFGGELALDEAGYVKTDESMRTNIPGVFAIGDLRSKKVRQLTTAVSDGTIAAVTLSQADR